MKKFFAIFTAVVLMPASQSMAGWRGGPFSNNNALPGADDGIYEAIATMSNGTGLFRFAVRNNGVDTQIALGGTTGPAGSTSSNVQFSAGLLNAQSSHVWYYKGITYYGVAFGIANSDMGIVSATGNASNNVGAAVTSNGVAISGSTGNNIGFANSNFIAKFRDKGPTFRFSGTGQVSFTGQVNSVAEVQAINPVTVTAGGNFAPVTTVGPSTTPGSVTTTIAGPPPVVTVTTPSTLTTLPGTRETTSAATTTLSPSGTTTTTTTVAEANISFGSNTFVSSGGEDSAFPERGHIRKFVVFGTKVSHSVAP